MTPTDARAVLEKMREGEAETLAALGDRPASWQSVQAMYAERLAALDVALSALALVAKFATLPVPEIDDQTCPELRALAEWIPEAALIPQEPTP